LIRRRLETLRAFGPDQWRVVGASLVLVPVVQIAVHAKGFVVTANKLAAWSDGPAGAPDLNGSRRAAKAVGVVASRKVVGAPCLARSLVLWFVLRRRGVDAEVVIGAEMPGGGPLFAHAWVEVLGEPINDDPTVRERFGSFGVQLPRLAQ
jgi:hypothetical protein